MSRITRAGLVVVLTAMLLAALVAAMLTTASVAFLIWAIRAVTVGGSRDG